jgi:hypothetical protein
MDRVVLPSVEFSVVDVNFDAVADPQLREYLQTLPTSFALTDEAGRPSAQRCRAGAARFAGLPGLRRVAVRATLTPRGGIVKSARRPMKHLTSWISFTAAVVLMLLLPVASPGAGPPKAPDGKSLAGKLLSYLGLDQAKRAQLESGEVVNNGLSGREQLPEEIVAAGAMLLVKAPEAGAVVDAFLHAETFLRIHRVQRYQALGGGSVELAAFSTMPLPDLGRLQELVKEPARNLNLNTAEAEKLKSLSSTASDLESRVRSSLAEIFAARLSAYAREGLPGVQPYVRVNGEVVNPAVELRTAIRGLAFLADEFPGFVDALGAPTSGPSPRLTRQYYWMERRVETDNVLALSAEFRRRDARVAIGADVHFYASREYNAMLTLIGVIPYGEEWMVFTLNHTFTDQVQGFGSSARRAIGRRLVAAELGKQLAETRRRLATGSKN